MPRAARVVVPDVSLHVVQRGHDGHDCFFQEGDYSAYLRYLREFAMRFGCSVHAYCLMTNHVHLLLTPHAAQACSQTMKYTAQYYVNRINKGTQWDALGGSVLFLSRPFGALCARLLPLYRAQSGRSWNGAAPA